MLSPTTGLFPQGGASTWVRLRTLILLRWMAVIGQASAIAVTHRWLGIDLPLGPCFLVIGASVITNLLATFIFPENKRLTENEAIGILLFDLAQLALLLALTGGLTNPFALLIVAPVTISAAALSPRSTLAIGTIAVVLTTLIAFINVPLRDSSGSVLGVPVMFETGFWLSIVIGVAFLGVYAQRVASEIRSMSEALLATQMALAREQKLTDLGGVVAAAAHEMGTPLATIKLVSGEIMAETEGNSNLAELFADAKLIHEQADRCRDILRSMGRAGKDDLHMRQAPLDTVLREAAEPHLERGKRIHFDIRPTDETDDETDLRQPTVRRAPEIIHGLRNLIQNAVDFARSEVWIDGHWSKDRISVRIIDDGHGYPPGMLGRIGDPFVTARSEPFSAEDRPGYEGMGLGLFIAKTLLERSGAELSFANGADPFLNEGERPVRSGAIVEVVWPLSRIAVRPEESIGSNPSINS